MSTVFELKAEVDRKKYLYDLASPEDRTAAIAAYNKAKNNLAIGRKEEQGQQSRSLVPSEGEIQDAQRVLVPIVADALAGLKATGEVARLAKDAWQRQLDEYTKILAETDEQDQQFLEQADKIEAIIAKCADQLLVVPFQVNAARTCLADMTRKVSVLRAMAAKLRKQAPSAPLRLLGRRQLPLAVRENGYIIGRQLNYAQAFATGNMVAIRNQPPRENPNTTIARAAVTGQNVERPSIMETLIVRCLHFDALAGLGKMLFYILIGFGGILFLYLVGTGIQDLLRQTGSTVFIAGTTAADGYWWSKIIGAGAQATGIVARIGAFFSGGGLAVAAGDAIMGAAPPADQQVGFYQQIYQQIFGGAAASVMFQRVK